MCWNRQRGCAMCNRKPAIKSTANDRCTISAHCLKTKMNVRWKKSGYRHQSSIQISFFNAKNSQIIPGKFLSPQQRTYSQNVPINWHISALMPTAIHGPTTLLRSSWIQLIFKWNVADHNSTPGRLWVWTQGLGGPAWNQGHMENISWIVESSLS